MNRFSELDMVTMTEDVEGIGAGTKGTILLELDVGVYLVEFFDEDWNTLDFFPVESRLLALEERYRTEAA